MRRDSFSSLAPLPPDGSTHVVDAVMDYLDTLSSGSPAAHAMAALHMWELEAVRCEATVSPSAVMESARVPLTRTCELPSVQSSSDTGPVHSSTVDNAFARKKPTRGEEVSPSSPDIASSTPPPPAASSDGPRGGGCFLQARYPCRAPPAASNDEWGADAFVGGNSSKGYEGAFSYEGGTPVATLRTTQGSQLEFPNLVNLPAAAEEGGCDLSFLCAGREAVRCLPG